MANFRKYPEVNHRTKIKIAYKKLSAIALCICFGILLFATAAITENRQPKLSDDRKLIAAAKKCSQTHAEESFDTEETILSETDGIAASDTQETIASDTEDRPYPWIQKWAEELDAADDQISFREAADGYILTLYDKENREIFSEFYPLDSRAIQQGLLWVNKTSKNVLEIGISVGSPARYIYFFDKETAEISPTYFNPIIVENNYVAYMEDHVLIFTDLFQRENIFLEIERNFTEYANPIDAIIDVKMIDQQSIELDYFEGENPSEKSEQIPLDIKEPVLLFFGRRTGIVLPLWYPADLL